MTDSKERVARRFRHKKRGTIYTLIGVGRAQGTLNDEEPVVLYRGDDGGLWVRHQTEFSDGRFEEVEALTRTDNDASGLVEALELIGKRKLSGPFKGGQVVGERREMIEIARAALAKHSNAKGGSHDL